MRFSAFVSFLFSLAELLSDKQKQASLAEMQGRLCNDAAEKIPKFSFAVSKKNNAEP